jgi:hypothetical protein
MPLKLQQACLSLLLINVCSVSAEVGKGLTGKATITGYYNDSPESWLNGGLGRFSTGDINNDGNAEAVGQIDIGYKGRFWSRFEFSTHLQARDSSYADERNLAGIVEAKLKYFQPTGENQRLLITAGQFFLPTSMENTENFWDSPYTITWSSLNSWLGEEFRPVGLDFDYKFSTSQTSSLAVAATVFGGNDSSGALLSWRGWSYGNNLSYYNEEIDLPDLLALADGEIYGKQQDSGTQPFGADLDDDPGYSLRVIWTSEDYELKLTGINTKGDTGIHEGEYAWETEFYIAGAKVNLNDNWVLLGEFSQGNTTMGPTADRVDVDFTTAYILTSYLDGDWRYSLRYDVFENDDAFPLISDINADEGNSITAAIFWEPVGSNLSIGAEILYLNQDRDRLVQASNAAFYSPSSSELLAINTPPNSVNINSGNTYQFSLEANWVF